MIAGNLYATVIQVEKVPINGIDHLQVQNVNFAVNVDNAKIKFKSLCY